MRKITIVFIAFLVLSQSFIVSAGKTFTDSKNIDETMEIIKQTLLKLSKKYNHDQIINPYKIEEIPIAGVLTKILSISSGKMTVYLGPKIIEILENLYKILQSENISYEEISNWGYDHGLNLLGISAGALVGYKLCSLLSITNPALKVATIIGLSYLGDQTVDFYKSTKKTSNELTIEDIESILKNDEELTPKIIKFIKENYLQISVFYINQII